MKVLIANQTRYMHGAHASTMLINDFVNARLGSYGPGVETVNVTLVYPPKSRPSSSSGGFADFWNLVNRCPRTRYLRAKRRIDILYLCSNVSVRSVESDGHVTKGEIVKIASAAAAGLELIRAKVGAAEGFDCDSFLKDATSALNEVPEALAGFLKPE